ncbi:sensor domain-containing diguanylate cyclase [Halobacillus litoralis]|uniref:sensor domain-containing diguanylate cyclase n=1 Tax=Halobacillus litoralis TaxID=45668 RepID=UPI001CD75C15|nr:sensor domain-containing diguanylate cyclase [Halobacillus litoralis]MCA0971223.1 sensor domain-containing diguanylate cyclase [Halobacillus litoralis]
MQGIANLLNAPSMLEEWLNSLDLAIGIVEQNGGSFTYTYVNQKLKKSHSTAVGKSIDEVYRKEEKEYLLTALEQAEKNGHHEVTISRPGWLQVYAIPSTSSYLLQWNHPRTSETQTGNYQSMVDQNTDSIFVHDEEDRIVFVNPAGVQLVGAESCGECIGMSVHGFIQDEPQSDVQNRLDRVFESEFSILPPIERKIKRFDGRVIEVELTGSKVIFDGKPAIQTICRVISERRRKQNRLEEMAYYDQLTQVSNRRYFFKKLQLELQEIDQTDSLLSVLFIDLDNFKDINDQYGHKIGDDVLVIFTKRIKQMLRETDTFSRLGGDEFVVLLTDFQAASVPEQVAERMIERIQQPIVLNGHELQISVSIGIAIYPDHGVTKDILLTRADQALYEAKNNGRKCVEVYQHPSESPYKQ